MDDTNTDEETEMGEETLSTLHIEGSKCDCPECGSGRNRYIQILDIERYVEHLNDWD